ncbi:putative quinol monooxygenase [Pseudomonas sp. NA-150]|uniref:putative quinol monooxygenase n=1 Tax=Pseudomonas sp. NA-150 TaxID=3367525 RepID=UPI0037CBB875
MNNAITVTLQMKVKPSLKDAFLDELTVRVAETLAFSGSLSMQVVRQHDDPCTVLFIEKWESTDAFNLYLAWRSQRNDMWRLGEMLSETPLMNVWSEVEVA